MIYLFTALYQHTNMRKTLLVITLLFSITFLHAQDFSNKGKDFWVGYGSHVSMYNTNNGTLIASGGSQEMVLYFTSDVLAHVTITIPATGWTKNYTITPPPAGTGLVESDPIPKTGTDDARLGAEQKYLKKGIHITSDKPIVAYAHIYNGSISGATLLFPTNTLGKEYYSLNYTQKSNSVYSYPYTFVIATEDSTIIQTTTTANTQTRTGGVTVTDTLMQGDMLNLLGQITNAGSTSTGVELTGTKVKSIASSTGQCKKIAVFSGSGKIDITCPAGTSGSADNYIQQCFPSTAWGKKYYTVPTKDLPFNYFRVMVKDPATVVKLNGVIQSGIINNTYYDLSLTNVPNLIEADQPIMVAQMITTQGACGNGSPGDPEMIYLSSIEQTIDKVTLNSTIHAAITKHYINVIIKASAASSFRLDNAVPATAFTPHPQDPTYVYAQFTVNAGVHQLQADSGFSAIAYGYGSAESYGYNAGTNIRDLYTFITPINILNISGLNTACSGTPFYYSVTYPFEPLSLAWNFYGAMGYPNVTVSNPASINDSTYFVNGRQVWRYKLSTPYTYTPAGVYPVSITAETSGSDGCGNYQVRDDSLYVFDPGAAAFTYQSTGCAADSVSFADVTQYPAGSGIYNYNWHWDFGDPASGTADSAATKYPKHKFSAPGTYTVTFTALDDIGCYTSPVTQTVTVTATPIAKFGLSSPICSGLPVTFSDTSSLAPPGNIVRWHWDFGDGFKIVRTTGNDTTHLYSPWNPAITDTLWTESNTGCMSLPFTKTFKVNPVPVSDFTVPVAVCLPWDSAHFVATPSIADNTTPFTYLWDFGDPGSIPNNASTLPNPAHWYSTAGSYSIKLTTTSAAGCMHDTTKVLSNIYPHAIASFIVNAENCFNTPTAFTSTSNGSGSTIVEYHWDFGDATTGLGASIAHTYATPGIKTIKHWIVTDKGCYSDTATLTVIINALPTADFTFSAPDCETRNTSFTDASVANSGTLSTWQWDFGDGSPLDNTQSPSHIYAAAGTYTVTLTVTNSKGCISAPIASKTVVVNARPQAGFIIPAVCLSDTYAQFVDTSKVAFPGNITAWEWNFGDGSPLNFTANPQHSYTAVGLYNVRLVVTSSLGCKDTITQVVSVNGSFPQANFTVNNAAALCANDSVAIVEASTVFPGNITKVEIYWDNVNFPAGPPQIDNIPFTGKVYKHLYPNFQTPLTKNFSIRYRAYSGGVCVNDKFTTITVNAAPKVQFNPIPDICYDAAPYQITQAGEMGGVPGTGVYSGPGVSPSGLFNPVAAGVGIHTIKYMYSSTAAGCVDSITQVIKVLDTASAKFSFIGPVCEGDPATFKEVSTAPAGVVLSNSVWDFGDGSPQESHAPGSTFTHLFPTWGNYTVTMHNTSAYGCNSKNITQSVYISPLPNAVFSFNETSVCIPNALISFNNTSSIPDGTNNQLTYAWDLGDLALSNAKTPAPHLYAGTGPYTVLLTVTSGSNCVKQVSHIINFIHPHPKAAFTFSKPEVCVGDFVIAIDQTDGLDGSVVKWYWNFGDGGIGSTPQVPHLYATAQTYNVSLYITNSNGCNSDTLTKPFTVHPYPVVDAGPDRVVLQGGAITILSNVTGNDLQYLWSPATYLDNTAIATPTASNMQDDITYTLTVTARGGCKAADNMFVKVLKAPRIPNTFTPNGDGINDTWIIQYLDTYPNNKVQVFTRNGQLVFESRGYKTPWDGTYNGKALPFDTYYYIIEPGNGRAPITGYVTIVK
ncbi:MAG: PKD domain-containing protein [Bacteroidetes bacterium]|nr:PKD domain-containing protein [Bacteroidota bacterium]